MDVGTIRLRRLVAGLALASGITAAAEAQSPNGPSTRAAVLLPPRASEPDRAMPLVRGAADDLSPLDSTPVKRPVRKAAAGPAWLTGVDPNVLPAAGTSIARPGEARPSAGSPTTTPMRLSPPASSFNDPTLLEKGINKLKGIPLPQREPAAAAAPPAAPPGTPADPRIPVDPNTPFQGTTAGGAPILAGPPAWRWYGYGSVTPGANTYAPTGQYPKASANWLSVTKATPGALPVPVMNPYRTAPGSEPPAYDPAPVVRAPLPLPVSSAPLPVARTPVVTTVQPPSRLVSPSQPPEKRMPDPVGLEPVRTRPVGVPVLAPLPAISPVGMAPLPIKPMEPVAAMPLPVPKLSEPTGLAPVMKPVMPASVPTLAAIKPAATTAPVAPSALPGSVTDEVRWQSTPEDVMPVAPGTWVPASNPPRTATPDGWQSSSDEPRTVVRGQIGDPQPDAVASLIQAMCRGRAADVDVRWTGSKRVTVCFEVRSAVDAKRLVADVSARPELAPLHIDFCVLVK